MEPRKAKRKDPLPHRGRGVQPDGQYCLATYTCVLYGGKRGAPPVVDSILLTADDMAAFAPPKPGSGPEWTVRESVARKFSRAISPSSDTSQMPEPEEVTFVELKATVDSVEAGVATIRLKGSWEATHVSKSDAQKRPSYSSSTAEGRALYDVEKKELRSLLLVFQGTWRMIAPYDAPSQSAGVVEWVRSTK